MAAVVVGAALGCGRPAGAPGMRDASDAPGPLDAPSDASVPDASPFDAPAGLPDLQFVADAMLGTVEVTVDFFMPDDCAVQEGCVGAPGWRTLVRFDTVTANLGTGDLRIGIPPEAGVSDGVFQWSPCHMHHHVADYASYELIDAAGNVTTARKQSFCLEDERQIVLGAPAHGYSCTDQGISYGYADAYARGLACQWIDATDLPHGAYTLRVTVNPKQTIVETDTTNNTITLAVPPL